MHCGPLGVSHGEGRDRELLVVNGKTGLFLTSRQHPKMILIEVKWGLVHGELLKLQSDIADSALTVSTPDGRSTTVSMKEVIAARNVTRATWAYNRFGKHRPVKCTRRLFDRLQADGLDCGDAMGELLSSYLQEPGTVPFYRLTYRSPDIRLIYYRLDLFNGRLCKTEQEWWNNPVPKRSDTVWYYRTSEHIEYF